MRSIRVAASAVAVVIAFWSAGVVQAGAIPWLTPSGTTPAGFDYSNGNTDNQLFVPAGTNPTVTATGLAFFPSSFATSSANGVSGIVNDTLRFQIHANTGKQLTGFVVDEYGDYTIFGSSAHTGVKAFGGLFITNLDTGEVRYDTLHTVPAPLNTSTGVTTGQGAWSGEEAINSIPAGWRNIQIVLNNELQANSDQGTSSFIEKKVVTPGIEINFIIPEPASLGLFSAAFGLLGLRRRRRIS